MKRAIISVLAISLGLLLKSCDTTDPPDNKSLTLKLEDVSCTEAWIELTTTNLQFPATITLKQTNPTGDTKSQILNLNTKDSLLYIDSLLPNQSYTFIASHSGLSGISSNELSVTTMDTTSHNFTFETFSFGGTAGSSTLYDVAIINENNIWAVGEIFVADTSQNGYTMYNAVHWDGIQWELKRINMLSSCNPVTYPPLRAIWAFSENNIVVTSGGSIGWFDGITNVPDCSIRPLLTSSINKIWGISSNDIYVVGNEGNIIRYNNGTWNRIESGTELNINDIWGDYNKKTGEWEILAVASNYGTGLEKQILLIKDNVVINIPTGSQMWPLLTTWFVPNKQYYVAGAGIYQRKLLMEGLWKNNATDITTFATTSIRGNNINDVFGVGAFGDFVHFNGVSWKNDYQEPLLSNGAYGSVTVRGKLFAATGYINREAVILIGRR